MSRNPVSIYSTIVFDLHPRIKEIIDRLNNEGQIDLDQNGHPFLVGVDRQGPNFLVNIARNNRMENFVVNPRRKAEPICSWKPEDGFVRSGGKQVVMVQVPDQNGPKRERMRRTFESFERLVDNILEG
jgi:hypothetical protein